MPLSRQDEFFVPEFSDELVSNATTELTGSHVDADASVSRSLYDRHDGLEQPQVNYFRLP
jgi:hypothetical protein